MALRSAGQAGCVFYFCYYISLFLMVLLFGGKLYQALMADLHKIFTECYRKRRGPSSGQLARDDPTTLPGDDPFSRARMHRDRNAL